MGAAGLALDAGEPRVTASPLAEAGMLLVAENDDLIEMLNLSALVRTLTLTIVPFTERDWSEAVMVYQSRRRSLGPGQRALANA